ncbi:hypothetical protein [Pseudomonas cyclaminis]|uniref:hypothetical protein n=1 Tax=Pseudomonas cyclaminis TaxID=2781239 RepID=UPI0019D60FF2|nr:hypothetical protein [Pseudomonas cyclaminis]
MHNLTICRQCGYVEELHLDEISDQLAALAQAKASTLSAKRLSFRAYVKHADP